MTTLRDFVDKGESVRGCIFESPRQYKGYENGFIYEAESIGSYLGLRIMRMQVLTTPGKLGKPVGQRFPLDVCLDDVFIRRANDTNV